MPVINIFANELEQRAKDVHTGVHHAFGAPHLGGPGTKLNDQKLAESFLNQSYFGKIGITTNTEEAKGSCETVAKDFSKFLQSKGIASDVVALTGFKGTIGKDAHPDWLKFKETPQYLWHAVTRIRNTGNVIDMTGVQYGSKYKGIVVKPWSEYKTKWNQSKVWEVFDVKGV